MLSFRPVRIFNSADSVDVLAGAALDMVMSAQLCVLKSRCESRSESLLLEAHSMWLPWAAGRLDGPCWTVHCSARAAEAQPEPLARRLPLAESPASPWARSWGFVRPARQPPNIHLPPHSSRIPSRRSGRPAEQPPGASRAAEWPKTAPREDGLRNMACRSVEHPDCKYMVG